MRFFYRVAQEEQRLEAPLHQRPSTPGLGACLPPNDTVVDIRDDHNSDDAVNRPDIPKSEMEAANNNDDTLTTIDSNKVPKDKISSPVDNKQTMTATREETNKTPMPPLTTVSAASSTTLTGINVAMLTTPMTTTNVSPSTCDDSNNKQIKSPIKIMKNSDGRYEVLKPPPANWNGKDQTVPSAAVTDIKPTSPEFSVVSIGNGQNSNGVKITLKQCSPTNGTNAKKPKVISNVLLRCGQVEKDPTSVLMQLQKDKDIASSLPSQDKQQEKQRRKVTFVDRPISERTSPSGTTIPKTALKKPAEQQDKKQFLQGFQLTARESVTENLTMKSPVREDAVANEIGSLYKKESATLKIDESLIKKDATIGIDEIRERDNAENAASNTSNSNNSATNTIAKRLGGALIGNTRTPMNKGSDDVLRRTTFNPGTSTNTSSSHSTRMDVYTFHSSDSPILPVGAVKRKCPPGLPIAEGKRKRFRQQIQTQNQGLKRQLVSSTNQPSVKLTRDSSVEQIVAVSRATSMTADHGGPSRVNNAKASTNPMLSNDTRNLLGGCGLNIPASLSITLTAPKSPGVSNQFIESNDLNDSRKPTALGKVNPSITLNDRSVDPRVLKALKTGQIKMPATPKAKSSATTKQTDRSEMNQQRTTPTAKRKREQESILDLSSGKKMDIHPLRIPQPVTKHKTNNKAIGRDGIPNIPDQGQVVTLMGGHRYYRAPPGSLTPAVHRVNDCSPLPMPSRAPVYAPTLADVNRTNSNLSAVFPSLKSLYALSQAPNLQQFQMDARLRLPPRATEGIATAGNSDSCPLSNVNSVTPGKTHLAAQCAPIKPARSSVAPLAVPINKQPQSADKSASVSINRTAVPSDTTKLSTFRSGEGLVSPGETTSRLTIQTKYSSNIESANELLSTRSNADSAKDNDQTIVENSRESNAESESRVRMQRNESVHTGNSMQQQQHHDTASPRVSSTASPSPPPGSGCMSSRNENSANHDDNNINNASNVTGRGGEGGGTEEAGEEREGERGNVPASATSLSPMKSNIGTEVTSSKSPASPDSSSLAVESPTRGKSRTILTDRETLTGGQTSDTTKPIDSVANLNEGSTIDGSVAPTDDKSKFANQSDAKQLTSEMVQKRLLAVFPSNEWANNPIAAEHLGNFLKSLNATMKSDGPTEESKTGEADRKTSGDNDSPKIGDDASVKLESRKDIVERS